MMRSQLRIKALVLAIACSGALVGSTRTLAMRYIVPAPEELKPYAELPTSSQIRIELQTGSVRLKYDIPQLLTGAETIDLSLEGATTPGREPQVGEVIELYGVIEGPDYQPNSEFSDAHATCTFVARRVAHCRVVYDAMPIDENAQMEYLMSQTLPEQDVARFVEVQRILSHEAIGIVESRVRVQR